MFDIHTGDAEIDSEIDYRISQIPPSLQSYIASEKFESTLDAIEHDYALDEEAAEKVGQEIVLILLGAEPPASLEQALVVEVLLPPDTAKRIAEYAKKEILTPLISEIENLNTNENPDENPGEPPQWSTASQPSATTVPAPAVPVRRDTADSPHNEIPARKASYRTMLDVPNYSSEHPRVSEETERTDSANPA